MESLILIPPAAVEKLREIFKAARTNRNLDPLTARLIESAVRQNFREEGREGEVLL